MTLTDTKKYLKKVALVFKKRRLGLKLTQKKLAKKTGISLSTFRNFERTGKISLENYVKLMFILGFSDYFLNSIKIYDKYETIDDVLAGENRKERKRGKRDV